MSQIIHRMDNYMFRDVMDDVQRAEWLADAAADWYGTPVRRGAVVSYQPDLIAMPETYVPVFTRRLKQAAKLANVPVEFMEQVVYTTAAFYAETGERPLWDMRSDLKTGKRMLEQESSEDELDVDVDELVDPAEFEADAASLNSLTDALAASVV